MHPKPNSPVDLSSLLRELALHEGPAPARVIVSVDAPDGMSVLSALDDALGRQWPASVVRELCWLPRGGAQRVELSLFDADGRVLRNLAHNLGGVAHVR